MINSRDLIYTNILDLTQKSTKNNKTALDSKGKLQP